MKQFLSVLTTLLLCVIIFFEFKIGFDMIAKKQLADADIIISSAEKYGKSHVTIDEIYEYEEIEYPVDNGDVVSITDYNIHVRVNGTVTDDSYADYGHITYASANQGNVPQKLNIEVRTTNTEEWRNAILDYFEGNETAILDYSGIAYKVDNCKFYQESAKTGRIASLFNGGTSLYYMFYDATDSIVILSSTEPFAVTTDKVTVHYGNPKANPMTYHTYSNYEVLAAANTRRELLDGDKDEDSKSPYQTDKVTGTSETYTSTSDNNKRRQMVSYNSYKWNKDGTSDNTTLTLDISSAAAIASQWVLTAETYNYENAGLKLYGLGGSRSNSELIISGTISNSIDAERPYVIVLKYLNQNNELLGITVLDYRAAPLGSVTSTKAAATFSAITKSVDMDIASVYAVQFEIH